jgi:cyclopropane fatty-acyl-phospholipid synthase-like methyltransferase
MIYKRIDHCRICKSNHLTAILDLGMQSLTGIFPPATKPEIESGPLKLIKCDECHLVQLEHNFDLSKLYGENYGYRSGLNQSMVDHLREKVSKILKLVEIEKGDIVLDIGANDGTTLGSYPDRTLRFVGMDPTGAKFKKYYKSDIELIPDFFSAKAFTQHLGAGKKAKIITSIAMFYDLEDPIDFAKQIASVLDTDGVWVFEQSYLPLMVEALAYDTICHEHLEYYGLYQIQKIVDSAGLRLVDVEFNKTNGGSFSVTVSHKNGALKSNDTVIGAALKEEVAHGYQSLELYKKFELDTQNHREKLTQKIHDLKSQGARIHGYGASTKGNVILQYCGFTTADLEVVAEVNEEKFGRVTPGTRIPITSEAKSKAMNPSHYLVLPWHFRQGIVNRERSYTEQGGKLIFPLPQIEVIP